VFDDAPRLEYLRAQWGALVSLVDPSSAEFDATVAGAPNGGAILVRPDGFIGFRAAPADEITMAALDATWRLIPCPNSVRTKPGSCRQPRGGGGAPLEDISRQLHELTYGVRARYAPLFINRRGGTMSETIG
jgi:hypothetical protein